MLRTSRNRVAVVAALALAVVPAACSLERASPTQPTPGYDLGAEAFAEMGPPPACIPDPDATQPTYFNPDVQDVLVKLGCDKPCHTLSNPTRLKLQDPTDFPRISVNYLAALGLLDTCDENARFLSNAAGNGDDIMASPTHKALYPDLFGSPDYEVLKAWILGCAAFSSGTPDPRCGYDFSLLDGGTDMPQQEDMPAPPVDMTAADIPGCNTTGLTYVANIDPLVAKRCPLCHTPQLSPPTLVSGNPMANYNALGGANVLQQRGFLYSTGHLGGMVIMPGTCEYQQVQAWVQAGAVLQ